MVMLDRSSNKVLLPIPTKRYFTISEVSELCGVKPHVLRYWGQEFTQIKPARRRGNRRYYQRQDIQLIRDIYVLLYEQGFTISGARQYLSDSDNKAQLKSTDDNKQLVHAMMAYLEEVRTLLST